MGGEEGAADKEDEADMARLQIVSPRDRIGANRYAADAGADLADVEAVADMVADAATKRNRGRGTIIGIIATAVAMTSKMAHKYNMPCLLML